MFTGTAEVRKADPPRRRRAVRVRGLDRPVREATCQEGSPWDRGTQEGALRQPGTQGSRPSPRGLQILMESPLQPVDQLRGALPQSANGAHAQPCLGFSRRHGQDSEDAHLKRYWSDGLRSSWAVREGLGPSSIKFASELHKNDTHPSR